MCQAVERMTYGGSRGGQAFGEKLLGQTLSRGEVATHEHLAQRQHRAVGLRRCIARSADRTTVRCRQDGA